MIWFITRVVLHHPAGEEDYVRLHALMAVAGFDRTITSDAGKEYHLPPAEYFSARENMDAAQVRDLASSIARQTQRNFSVLVTETASIAWNNLAPVGLLAAPRRPR
jgi:hypothetical protein